MQEANVFSMKTIIEWEEKPKADKTWDNLTKHFTAEWNKNRQCDRIKATGTRNHGATNGMAESGEGAEPKQDDAMEDGATDAMAMMMATLHKVHEDQVNQIREDDKAALDMCKTTMEAVLKLMEDRKAGDGTCMLTDPST